MGSGEIGLKPQSLRPRAPWNSVSFFLSFIPFPLSFPNPSLLEVALLEACTSRHRRDAQLHLVLWLGLTSTEVTHPVLVHRVQYDAQRETSWSWLDSRTFMCAQWVARNGNVRVIWCCCSVASRSLISFISKCLSCKSELITQVCSHQVLTLSFVSCVYKLPLKFWRRKVKTEGTVRAMLPPKVLEKWPPLLLPNSQKIPALVGSPWLTKLSLQS